MQGYVIWDRDLRYSTVQRQRVIILCVHISQKIGTKTICRDCLRNFLVAFPADVPQPTCHGPGYTDDWEVTSDLTGTFLVDNRDIEGVYTRYLLHLGQQVYALG